MHIHGKQPDNEKGRRKPSLKSEEPLAEGPAKGIIRRRFLKLGGAALAAALAGCIWDPSGLAPNISDDAGHIDAKTKDAEVIPDAKQPDARPDTAVPDSAVPDSAVHDAGVDSGPVDAEAPDSSVPDAGFDAGPDAGGPVCATYEQSRSFWFLEMNNSGAIGGYNVQYTAQNGNDSTLSITCESTGNAVTSDVFALGVQRTVYLSQGNKNLTITITDVWPDIIKMDANVSNP